MNNRNKNNFSILLMSFFVMGTFCACGTMGGDFWSALSSGLNRGVAQGLQYNAYQSSTTSRQTSTTGNTQLRKADNEGGVYVGNKYVNLNAYGVSNEGQFVNTINAGSPVYSNSSSSTSSSSSSTSGSSRLCTICGGTGKVKRSLPSSSYGLDTSKKQCPTCGEMMMSPGHTHITCTNCHGTGKVKN